MVKGKGAQASSSYVPQLVKFGNNVKFSLQWTTEWERERDGERERGREMPQRQPDKRQAVVHMDGLLPVETTSIDTATHFRGSNKATTATTTTRTEAATSSTTKVKFFVLLVA